MYSNGKVHRPALSCSISQRLDRVPRSRRARRTRRWAKPSVMEARRKITKCRAGPQNHQRTDPSRQGTAEADPLIGHGLVTDTKQSFDQTSRMTAPSPDLPPKVKGMLHLRSASRNPLLTCEGRAMLRVLHMRDPPTMSPMAPFIYARALFLMPYIFPVSYERAFILL